MASQYILDNKRLKESESERDLGVIIDKNLRFSDHCNNVANSANVALGMIKITINSKSKSIITGSTTAAIIYLLNKITTMLEKIQYVRVIALDFSKAFDTVKHSELCRKLAGTQITDKVYNWITDYISGRFHCTKYEGKISAPEKINASIVQGSAIGPVAYILTASDLKVASQGNEMSKYADDTYLLIPESNDHTTQDELVNVENWARANNLSLNRAKTKEMIVARRRLITSPNTTSGIERVTSLNVLGVEIQDDLKMRGHISNLIAGANRDLFALKTLRNHGLPQNNLAQVCRATLVSKLTYASPAWRAYCNAEEISMISAVERKARRWGLWGDSRETIENVLDLADKQLFEKILKQPHHPLRGLMPPIKKTVYNLRERSHPFQLPAKTVCNTRNFITRMLYNF